MFKQAFVRGLQSTLIQSGHVAYPSDEVATKVADYVANQASFDPTKYLVDREFGLKIANELIRHSNDIAAKGYKAAPVAKLASVEDLNQLTHSNVIDLMQKAAEGSNIEGGDKGNTTPESAEGKMDLKERPHGYAEDSRGKTDVDTRPGAVGKEMEQPNKPSVSPSGTNSVEEQSKTSGLAALVAKLAEGSNMVGGDKGNKEPTTAEGKMDAALRPEGYAVLPHQGDLGAMMALVAGPAVVGKEMKQPMTPGQTVSGSNSLTEHSAKAASEDPFLALFKKTAAEVAPFLPSNLSDSEKVAQVRALMGFTMEEKATYLVGMQKAAADATASLPPDSRGDHYAKHSPDATHSRPGAYDGRKQNQGSKVAELPDFIQAKIDAKKDGDEGEKKDDSEKKHENPFAKKDDDKKDEKKDDEKKEGSLLSHFQRIAATVQS